MSIKTILIVIEFNAQFGEMILLYRKLLKTKGYRPQMLFCGDFDYTNELARAPDERDAFCFLESDGTITSARGHELAILNRIKTHKKKDSFLVRAFRRLFPRQSSFLYLPQHLLRLSKLVNYSKCILKTFSPTLVVLPNIGMGNISGVLAKLSKRCGIPVLVVPYSWNGRLEYYTLVKNNRVYSANTLVGKVVAWIWPKWRYQDSLAWPPVKIVSLELLGLAPITPWMPDGDADSVTVESEAMLESQVFDGIPKRKCLVTGSFWLDHLNGSILRKSEILKKLQANFPQGWDGRFVLSTLPPDQTGNNVGGFEFPDYWTMLEFWISSLVKCTSLPVVLSLHPRILQMGIIEKIRQISSRVHIYEGDILDIIGMPLFVVGTLSGVLRGALAMGVPVLYYDVFHYRLNEYADVTGVQYAKSYIEYEDRLKEFSSSTEKIVEMKKNQMKSASRWGVLDGKSGDRILDLIDQLVAGKLERIA